MFGLLGSNQETNKLKETIEQTTPDTLGTHKDLMKEKTLRHRQRGAKDLNRQDNKTQVKTIRPGQVIKTGGKHRGSKTQDF